MKKLYIETFGCQMNVKDTEHIIGELSDIYTPTQNPKEADLIIINTCSVREKPVQKLFSELGALKKENPNAKFGVCGCTASHMGEEIIKRAPYVSFVLGARNVSRIKEAINKEKAVITDIDYDDTTYVFKNTRKNPYKDFVNIMVGCDKKCTFCIVPKTRGKELSIPMDLILKQVEELANDGVKEITLLGQNVNTYGKRFSVPHPKVDFTDLLREVSKIDGIERIRFTSPHPLHADDKFLDEFANNPKICKHIHFPLQSGSSEILKAMKRGYTKEWFLNRAEIIRQIPDVAISTDIIVGFPGESEEDFKDTLEVVEKVRFEQIFSFVYSPRPLTEAAEFPNQVPKDIAKKRLWQLQELHAQILEEISKEQIGKTYKVLVEEVGMGKSDNFFTVKLDKDPNLLGKIVDVKIEEANKHTLKGRVI
ncbi:tRNA (N6-isopentenyl adenosine(37)-C2)-methylthiotransferase MiaB [Caminibacter pacificus]|jgi:tRNA-2-methylthio-N6-dimethylallyladenosine synthase|uniref:tRNA-2-methylthio-N(6)-dimethylallyladenosine synthase n=2 Tax=Caminibacter pacificus TaxID=1424653 RepID=A0AAJ4UXX0_9BACT|nr:tRNA (N6-isopentenyl adenosine(37)-C2)-methylthiotransferase MiaB [Caminibacter pacificus]NPA88200.1 tRNA (N6-isopentenyl adenosine(37)-C2)-methylthiotransferase MiaB [Campylobacterota bacterium]QCI27711.1 tRNA (N6-isopentenyl adenosine(37)-C2)-methylthiotransferase MiaB [Caminibacter pacificus]ROR40113.1 tRNA-i(6)A37 thiotransferase enzyme MiaB [Caminibacter pacificus]